MKKLIFTIISAIVFITSNCHAENRWNIYAGGSLSHICETPWASTDKSYGWGGGAFIGAGYELNFTPNWILTPQLEFAFDDNGGVLSATDDTFFNNHSAWQNYWSVGIPIVASYRVAVVKDVCLRIGMGPYLQEGIKGHRYSTVPDSQSKEDMPGGFGLRFNTGAIGEFAVETGNHLSYMFRTRYPFIKKGWFKNTITLSVGIKYSF